MLRHWFPVLALAVACTGAPADTTDSTADSPADSDGTAEVESDLPESVAKAAQIANADDKAKALEDAGMSEGDLEALMFEIAADAELSKAYVEATK